MDGNLQHIIIPAKLNTAAPDTNTLTFLILENTMGPVIEPIQFPNVNIDAIVPHTFISIPYMVCNAIGIKVDKVTVLPRAIIMQINEKKDGRVTPHSVGRCREATEGSGRVSGPAKRVGERALVSSEASGPGEALSLRPFGPPPSQREVFPRADSESAPTVNTASI